MTTDNTEQILQRIRDAGYSVEAGTEGYSIKIVATDAEGEKTEAVAKDEHQAAMKLAAALEIELGESGHSS